MSIRQNAEVLRALGGPGSGPHKGGPFHTNSHAEEHAAKEAKRTGQDHYIKPVQDEKTGINNFHVHPEPVMGWSSKVTSDGTVHKRPPHYTSGHHF